MSLIKIKSMPRDQHLDAASGATLRAVVAVDKERRVRCQQPGCTCSVYAAVHVVEERDGFLVLGSTCFEKRYGRLDALGEPQFGGAKGRKLTDEERAMLIENTHALLTHFEAQAAAQRAATALAQEQAWAAELRHKQQMADKLQQLRSAYEERQSHARAPERPGIRPPPASPWPWQKVRSSVALFKSPAGVHWVRVQHRDGSQKLMPWPPFPGWQTALPYSVGEPDEAIGGIAVRNIEEAIRVLRQCGYEGPRIGDWREVLGPTSAGFRREPP